MKIKPLGARDWGGFVRSTFPIVQWLPQYRRNWLRLDLLAGLTVAAYAIPVSVAYASLAGLPPERERKLYPSPASEHTSKGKRKHIGVEDCAPPGCRCGIGAGNFGRSPQVAAAG
jgi:hypothetical protein